MDSAKSPGAMSKQVETKPVEPLSPSLKCELLPQTGSPLSPSLKTEKASSSHIQHLNGLRALAFIGVVIFHFQHGCQGGFLGVDVFFLLSGYLMTRSLAAQISLGRFSYPSFLWRRFWRLCPALLLTTLGTLLGAYAFFPSVLVTKTAKSAYASTFAYSNLLFMTEDGYFGTASALKPLLHTWSLSVEWQFYLLWPVILKNASRFSGRVGPFWPLMALCAASFVHGLQVATTMPQAAFFMLPGRAFEFGLGALLLTAPTVTNPSLGNAMSLSGTAMIVLSFTYLNASHGAPAVIALPSLIGALLVIASPSSVMGNRLYTSAPLDYLGKISYSAYLVHWPVYVFFHNIYEHTGPPRMVEATVVVLMMACSALMYHYVEDEFRTGKKWWHKVVGAALLVSVLLSSRDAINTNGWEMRSSNTSSKAPPKQPLASYWEELSATSQRRPQNKLMAQGTEEEVEYVVVPSPSNKTVEEHEDFAGVLVGDSFAASFDKVLDVIGSEMNKTFLIASHWGCAPFFDNRSMTVIDEDFGHERREKCKEHLRRNMLELIKASNAPTVFLVGNWLESIQMKMVLEGPSNKTSQLEETISILHKIGKKVVLIGMVPGAHYEVGQCVSARGPLSHLKECPATSRFKEPFLGTEQQQHTMKGRVRMREAFANLMNSSSLLSAGQEENWLSYIDPFSSLCLEDTGECAVIRDNEALYSDGHHLGRQASLALTDAFRKAINGVRGESI